jgi:hypothetical protein
MTARSVGSAVDEGPQPSRNVRFSAVIGGKPDMTRMAQFGSEGPVPDFAAVAATSLAVSQFKVLRGS